jgi:hypothetical protein
LLHCAGNRKLLILSNKYQVYKVIALLLILEIQPTLN